MQAQVGRRVAHHVLVILRVVAAIKGPLAKPVLAVDVLDRTLRLVLPHHGDARLHEILAERGGLTHEAAHHLLLSLIHI